MTDSESLETFPALRACPGLVHGFVLRDPEIPVDCDRETALDRLRPHFESTLSDQLGLSFEAGWFGEQTHSDRIAVCPFPVEGRDRQAPDTDGLVTDSPGEFLGIYVADCCAVYLVDPKHRVCGLVHSGKNGSALDIAARGIERMTREFGTDPADMVVQLSPCIRPPAYEIDFAAQIRTSCREAGVLDSRIHDPGACTSRDLARYYSYRVEKGKTGRMLAVIAWAP